MMALQDRQDRDRLRSEKEAMIVQRASMDKFVNTLREQEMVVQSLTNAVLLTSGYHNHKGQWRKRRNAKQKIGNES